MSEPKFTPKPGQVNYSNIRYAPVVNTVVKSGGKVLLVQRSSGMRLYPNYWNGISGFLDDARSIEEKVAEELHEELGIEKDMIVSLTRGQPLLQEAPENNKTWLVIPVLAKVTAKEFKLNWEAQAGQWFTPGEIKNLNLLPGFIDVINQFIKVI
jgi:NADH pyrophosphatase NudC (nudix superfamily)